MISLNTYIEQGRESLGTGLKGRMSEGRAMKRRYERTEKQGILSKSIGTGLQRNRGTGQKGTGGEMHEGAWQRRNNELHVQRIVVLPLRLPPR